MRHMIFEGAEPVNEGMLTVLKDRDVITGRTDMVGVPAACGSPAVMLADFILAYGTDPGMTDSMDRVCGIYTGGNMYCIEYDAEFVNPYIHAVYLSKDPDAVPTGTMDMTVAMYGDGTHGTMEPLLRLLRSYYGDRDVIVTAEEQNPDGVYKICFWTRAPYMNAPV